jgi:hypothetical protein
LPRPSKDVLRRELASARRSLRALEKSLKRLGARIDHFILGGVAAERKKRRKPKLSPARLKALRLHGRYLGYLRQLKPRAKAEVRTVRENKGVEAAIKRARKLAGS